MPQLTFNSLAIPNAAKSLEAVPEYVGDFAVRGANGQLDENFIARKRRWTCKVVAQTPLTAIALRRYLEGEGQSFDFAAHMYSFKGEGPASGGSYTRSDTGGKHAGKVSVDSGDALSYELADALYHDGRTWDPTRGFTFAAWKKLSVGDGGDGTAYHHHVATGDVAVVRGASANPAGVTQYKDGVAGAHAMGNWIAVGADGVVSIHGKTNANGDAAYDYSGLVVLPFKLDPLTAQTWATALYTHMNAGEHSALRKVLLAGEATSGEDFGRGVEVLVRVVKERWVRRVIAGVTYPNARELDLAIAEF